MLDDQPSYLSGATKAGMRTILVRPDGVTSNGIDATVPYILDAEPMLESMVLLKKPDVLIYENTPAINIKKSPWR